MNLFAAILSLAMAIGAVPQVLAETEGRRCGELTYEETYFHVSPPTKVFVITDGGCRYETEPLEKLDSDISAKLSAKIAKAKKTGQPARACIKGWIAGGPACENWAAFFSYIESVQ